MVDDLAYFARKGIGAVLGIPGLVVMVGGVFYIFVDPTAGLGMYIGGKIAFMFGYILWDA